MKGGLSKFVCSVACSAVLASSMATDVTAHGGGNWNAFRIDRVVDDVKAQVLQAQQEISDLIRGRTEAAVWPVPDLKRTRDELIVLKEQVDEILEHYVADGVNLQSAENLRAKPRSGRSVAASQALDACIALLERAATVESQDAFIKEFYARGPAARIYELVDAHRDRMDLYEVLTVSAERENVNTT